jgi:hypothetical protein
VLFLDLPNWTFQLEDGVCTNSLALHTAREYGISADILRRAGELGHQYDELWQQQPGARRQAAVEDHNNDGHSKATAADATRVRYDLVRDIYPILLEQSAHNGTNLICNEPVIVEHGWEPPPILEGRHSVYVLQLSRDNVSFECYVFVVC